jgi:hypothetical protein
MKHPIVPLALSLACGICITNAAEKRLTLQEKPALNRFGLSYRPGFNISANFNNLGRLPASAPGLAAGGVPHTYDDGFVLVDISGNAGGQTWNWGYADARQIMGPNLVLSSSLPGTLARDRENDPQQGFEFTYARQLGQAKRTRWGLESAFNFTAVNLRHGAPAPVGVLAVDAFSLGGIIPPLAPYAGTFAGPGPLISDAPVRSSFNVDSRFNASMYGLRLGPYLDVSVSKALTLNFSAGLAAVTVDGRYRYEELAVAPGSGSILRHGLGHKTAFHAGGFVAANLSYQVTKAVNVFAGIQFQSVGKHSHTVDDKQTVLDLRKSLFATLGLDVSF